MLPPCPTYSNEYKYTGTFWAATSLTSKSVGALNVASVMNWNYFQNIRLTVQQSFFIIILHENILTSTSNWTAVYLFTQSSSVPYSSLIAKETFSTLVLYPNVFGRIDTKMILKKVYIIVLVKNGKYCNKQWHNS